MLQDAVQWVRRVFQRILLGILFYPSDNIATMDKMSTTCTTDSFNGHFTIITVNNE